MAREEEDSCPLCLEELDVTDRALRFCGCGCERGGGEGGRWAAGRCACARPPLRHGLPPRGLAAPTPLALVALTPCLPGLHPAPADQICLWCYHHILEEAAKESLPARCPNCRTDYDQEKITMQQIDAQQCVHRGRAWGARRRSCAHVLAGRAHPAG